MLKNLTRKGLNNLFKTPFKKKQLKLNKILFKIFHKIQFTLQISGLGSFLHAPRISLTSSKLNPFSWIALADFCTYH